MSNIHNTIKKLDQISEGNLGDMAIEAEKDHEVQMARSDCFKSASYAIAIHKMLKEVSELEGIDGWVAAKITKAADYLGSVKHHMEGEMMANAELAISVTNAPQEPEPMQMDMPEESIEEGATQYGIIRYPDTAISYVKNDGKGWEHIYDKSYGFKGTVDKADLEHMSSIDKNKIPSRMFEMNESAYNFWGTK